MSTGDSMHPPGGGPEAAEAPMCLAIQKPKKNPVYEGKIGGKKNHILFCNEFSICTIFTRDSVSEIPHPWCRGSRGSAPGSSIGFSILKAARKPILEGKIGGKIHM